MMRRCVFLVLLVLMFSHAQADQIDTWLAEVGKLRDRVSEFIRTTRREIENRFFANTPATASSAVLSLDTRTPTMQRLERNSLLRLRSERQALSAKRQPVVLKTGYQDYRCIIHAHCYLSHDSNGTIEEITAAAKQVGIDAIFMSDHIQEKDVVAEGPRGEKDGVLFVPGSENRNFLLYPADYKLPDLSLSNQGLIDAVRKTGGQVFVAHPEGLQDWGLQNLTGMEIYNIHVDFMDEAQLYAALQPKDSAGYAKLLSLLDAMNAYPHEAFAALYDYPKAFLERYDQMVAQKPFTAIAANDSHQNVGFVVKGAPDGKYRVEDALGELITELDSKQTPALKLLFGEPVPDKILLKRQLDPYPVSFHYVSTHVLAKERTERALRDALTAGRTYVAFDWIADTTGAAFVLKEGQKTYTLGDTMQWKSGMQLEAEVPLEATLRLMKDGQEVLKTQGRVLKYEVKEPGNYRLEAFVTLCDEPRAWILTGAIRVQR